MNMHLHFRFARTTALCLAAILFFSERAMAWSSHQLDMQSSHDTIPALSQRQRSPANLKMERFDIFPVRPPLEAPKRRGAAGVLGKLLIFFVFLLIIRYFIS